MRYQGGKDKLAKRIVTDVFAPRYEGQTYYEPFAGGLNVARRVAVMLRPARMVLADAHPDLILLYKAWAEGWRPPTDISEQDYASLRHVTPSPLRGFVGFCCSWGGKWWGGYARGEGRNFAAESYRNLDKTFTDLSHCPRVDFRCSDYHRYPMQDAFIYADPPYEGTTGYAMGSFDHAAFWRTMGRWSTRSTVLVSSYEARPGWRSVWQSAHFDGLGTRGERVERIFTRADG